MKDDVEFSIRGHYYSTERDLIVLDAQCPWNAQCFGLIAAAIFSCGIEYLFSYVKMSCICVVE